MSLKIKKKSVACLLGPENINAHMKRDYTETNTTNSRYPKRSSHYFPRNDVRFYKWGNMSQVWGSWDNGAWKHCHLLPEFPLCSLHHIVAWFAFISADSAHVVTTPHTARQEQVGIWNDRGSVTFHLAVDFRKWPYPIFKAGQPRAQSWLQKREIQGAQKVEWTVKSMKICQSIKILQKSQSPFLSGVSIIYIKCSSCILLPTEHPL